MILEYLSAGNQQVAEGDEEIEDAVGIPGLPERLNNLTEHVGGELSVFRAIINHFRAELKKHGVGSSSIANKFMLDPCDEYWNLSRYSGFHLVDERLEHLPKTAAKSTGHRGFSRPEIHCTFLPSRS